MQQAVRTYMVRSCFVPLVPLLAGTHSIGTPDQYPKMCYSYPCIIPGTSMLDGNAYWYNTRTCSCSHATTGQRGTTYLLLLGIPRFGPLTDRLLNPFGAAVPS